MAGIHTSYAKPLLPHHPTRAEVLTACKEAAQLDSLAKNFILKNNVKANWQPDSKSFWYRNSLPDNPAAFFQVDVRTGVKTKLLDTSKLVPYKDNGYISGGIRSRWGRQRPSDSLSPGRQRIASISVGNMFLRPG